MSRTTTKSQDSSATIGELMKEIEFAIKQLESEDVSLEECLESFEHGIGLVRDLQNNLADAEQRIQLIVNESATSPDQGNTGQQ